MNSDKLAIFQAPSGAIELSIDAGAETIWATQAQMAFLFGIDQSGIARHVKNILDEDEVDAKSNMQKVHIANSDRPVTLYSLDIILAVGYRANSGNAIKFRKWATSTLRTYITEGFVINPARIERNKSHFLHAIEDMKLLAVDSDVVGSTEVADLASAFAGTWLSLDAYDKDDLPNSGHTKSDILVGAEDLSQELVNLRKKLIEGGEATEIFGIEREKGGLKALFGNVFQSFDGADVYPTIEEKAAHLLYFVAKNHVFLDGNKRSGAYSFVWFLRAAGILNFHEISPQALTAITLLVAESKPEDKDKMIGLVLLMLGVERRS